MKTWQFIFTDAARAFAYEASAGTEHDAMLKARAMLFLAYGRERPVLASEYSVRERTPLHLTSVINLGSGEYNWEPLSLEAA